MKNEKEAARRNVLVVEAVLIAILVMALTVLLVLYFEKDAPEQWGELSFEKMETAVSDGDESETAPQPEYVYERIHLEDSILGDISIPTMPDVRRHSYSWDNLTEENGRYYYESDTWQSRTGIDVSYFQGEIDWEQVKNDGIDFAIIRLGGLRVRGHRARGGNIPAETCGWCRRAGFAAAGRPGRWPGRRLLW